MKRSIALESFFASTLSANWSALLLRLACGLALLPYAINKIKSFHTEKNFPTVKPFTSRQAFLLAMCIETCASFCMIFGLFTRLACIPGICNMAVAYHINHQSGFRAPSLSYLLMFIAILFVGPGAFSLDYLFFSF